MDMKREDTLGRSAGQSASETHTQVNEEVKWSHYSNVDATW